jgi:hypothetical protein
VRLRYRDFLLFVLITLLLCTTDALCQMARYRPEDEYINPFWMYLPPYLVYIAVSVLGVATIIELLRLAFTETSRFFTKICYYASGFLLSYELFIWTRRFVH